MAEEYIDYIKKKARGHIFYFKYDHDAPDLLHIYARHLTEPVDAIKTFFTSTPEWNEKRERFENYSETHGLFWFWLNEIEKKVMIVTCFRREK
jgi:hypothetical protein